MILEAIATAGFVSQVLRAIDLDDKALLSLRQAYDTHANAVVLFERRKEAADTSLKKLVNRKKAIYITRMQEFLNLYGQIRSIQFLPGQGIRELFNCKISAEDVQELRQMAITSKQPLSEKEQAMQFVFRGLDGSILADSKRNLEIANTQLSIAKTIYISAENMSMVMDAIAQRAEQFSTILSTLSQRFGILLNNAKIIVDQNGTDGSKYSKKDIAILCDCMNFADAIKKYLDIPILNQDGSVTEETLKALEEGKALLSQFQQQV